MPDPHQSDEVTPEETQRLCQTGEAKLVDCREDDEYAYCRIESAQLIPLSKFSEIAVKEMGDDHEQFTIVYCHHGVRSLQATHFLRQQGYGNVFSMAGGIDLWSERVDRDVPRY